MFRSNRVTAENTWYFFELIVGTILIDWKCLGQIEVWRRRFSSWSSVLSSWRASPRRRRRSRRRRRGWSRKRSHKATSTGPEYMQKTPSGRYPEQPSFSVRRSRFASFVCIRIRPTNSIGPPGSASGSVSHKYGSGSGFSSGSGTGSFHHQAKVVKNLDFSCFVTSS